MHYTSIENIHKVIDPLFLDELREELNEIRQISAIKTREKRLLAFREKIAGLKFLDAKLPDSIQTHEGVTGQTAA